MLTLCGLLLLQFSVVVVVAGVGHITLPRRVKRQLYAEETMRQCHLNIVRAEGEPSLSRWHRIFPLYVLFFLLFFGFLIRNIWKLLSSGQGVTLVASDHCQGQANDICPEWERQRECGRESRILMRLVKHWGVRSRGDHSADMAH